MVRVTLSEWVSPTPFADLIDAALADEDNNINTIPTDDANRPIIDNVAIIVAANL